MARWLRGSISSYAIGDATEHRSSRLRAAEQRITLAGCTPRRGAFILEIV